MPFFKYSAVVLTGLYCHNVPAQVIEEAGTHEGIIRLPWFLDVWAALFLVIFAMSLAHLLNHQYQKVRSIAALVAGIALLAVSGVVMTIELMDRWTYFTSAILGPWHHWIPTTLRIISFITFISGVLIIWLSRRSGNGKDKTLEMHNSTDTYGRVSRFLHWSIAIMMPSSEC